MMNDERQMIVLEALRILEKRVERNLHNAENLLKIAEERNPTSSVAVWEWKNAIGEEKKRLEAIAGARKEVLGNDL